ncbi:MAG TPA: FAD:protein FMN transferase, partial [Candidimonas sp.]|nr:FAD:protein FMN transferase [Candidimonas sp.]
MPKTSSEPLFSKRTTLHGPTMGTRWSAIVDHDANQDVDTLREQLAAVVQQLDDQMSPWKPDSDLVRLNGAPLDAWVELPSEILEVLACALDIHRLSAGAFDPGVGALVDAWGFGAERDAPDADAIRS